MSNDVSRESGGSRVDPSRSYPHSPEALTPPITASPPVGGATRELCTLVEGCAFAAGHTGKCLGRFQPRSPVEAGAPEEATALTHSRSCGYHDSETGCTCCLDERIAADNWREQYAAWFKRANEAETEVATLRARVSQLAEISGRIESVVDTDFAHDEPARAVGVVVDVLGVSEAARLSAEQETERLREELRLREKP